MYKESSMFYLLIIDIDSNKMLTRMIIFWLPMFPLAALTIPILSPGLQTDLRPALVLQPSELPPDSEMWQRGKLPAAGAGPQHEMESVLWLQTLLQLNIK